MELLSPNIVEVHNRCLNPLLSNLQMLRALPLSINNNPCFFKTRTLTVNKAMMLLDQHPLTTHQILKLSSSRIWASFKDSKLCQILDNQLDNNNTEDLLCSKASIFNNKIKDSYNKWKGCPSILIPTCT
jgi:hypothetical protein